MTDQDARRWATVTHVLGSWTRVHGLDMTIFPDVLEVVHAFQVLPEDTKEWALRAGRITPAMTLKDVRSFRVAFDKADQRGAR